MFWGFSVLFNIRNTLPKSVPLLLLRPVYVMELGYLLTRSGLTNPEDSTMVCHDSFCQSGSSVSLPWVIYYKAFSLRVLSSVSYIPVMCPKLVLFLIPLQFVYLFCNLFECILLFFSRISSLLLLFFWRPLLYSENYESRHLALSFGLILLPLTLHLSILNGKQFAHNLRHFA